MKGIELFARIAFAPCKLGYCGTPDDAEFHQKLFDFVAGKKDEEKESELRAGIRKFPTAWPYLRAISKKNSFDDILDLRAVEAYYFGNPFLQKCSSEQIKEVIENDFSQVLPKEVSQKLLLSLPEQALPHHSFHAFFIGSVSPRIEKTVSFMDNCRVGYGKIKGISKNSLNVEYRPLISFNSKLILGPYIRKPLSFFPEFIPKPKRGTFVAFHWNTAVLELSKEQLDNLMHFTQQSLNAINSHK